MRRGTPVRLAACTVLALTPALAFATNGYFSHGIGMKAKGMGGASIAAAGDVLAAAGNPAVLGHVGTRVDLGIELFRPDRGSEIAGNMNTPLNAEYDANDTQDFFVPEFGIAKVLGSGVSVGLLAYGRGGMNTSYATPIGLFGTSKAGIDLQQLIVAPTASLRVGERHTFGLAVNLAYQRFKATGLENFTVTSPQPYSLHPDKVTNNDYSSSTGVGVQVGWAGTVIPGVTLGANYQSKIDASEFDDYAGLFAEEGGFDIPSTFGAGIAVEAGEKALIAVDVTRILYTDVKSVSNPLLPNLAQAPLGDEKGAGFGWEDVTVFKAGISAEATKALTVRCGYNYGKQPIPESETLFNMLAPGVVEHHVTLGATWKLPVGGEVTAAYMHAFEKSVDGDGSIPPGMPAEGGMGGGEANLRMSEDSFGLAYGRSF
jgi:long-chain fatty acid transport protein